MVRTMCATCFHELRQTSAQPRKALSVAHEGDRCTGCGNQSEYVIGYWDGTKWKIERW